MTGLALCAALLLPRPASAGPRLSPAAATRLDEGLALLYSLDYARSRAAFRRLIELEPENPFGYLFEAGGLWWESAQEPGLFQAAPALRDLFENDVAQARSKAAAYIDSQDPQLRADGYFVSGMALGTLGQWRLMQGHWMEAYFAGKKAIKNLKKCVSLDPDYYDAYLGLGVFDYQAAHFSGIARLGFLLGMRGNEKRGLAEIRLAADKARYASRQACAFLLWIDFSDRRDFASALSEARTLSADFPLSPYYLFVEIAARERLGDRDGSLALARRLYGRIAENPPAFRPKWLTVACGLSGPDCLSKDDAALALPWFDFAIAASAQETPSGWHALLRLIRGHLLDVLGRREEAVAEYRQAETLPDFDFSRERAAACAQSPCGRDEILRLLRGWSRAEPAAAN